MNKNENLISEHITVLLVILFPLITVMSSCQKDKTLDLDITESMWELKSITDDGNTQKKPSGDFQRRGAYILWFSSDSSFILNTSANLAGGKFKIILKGEIELISYQIMTLACCDTDFDEAMIDVLKRMTTYTVRGKTLTFKGNNSEVKFEKK
jgi:hypothetical protein